MEPMVNTEPASLSPEQDKGQVCSPGSRGTPVAVVIVVRVAQGEGQAGLALRILLLTLPRGTVLEEVRDVVDLEKNNGQDGLGMPVPAQAGAQPRTRLHGGHSQ